MRLEDSGEKKRDLRGRYLEGTRSELLGGVRGTLESLGAVARSASQIIT